MFNKALASLAIVAVVLAAWGATAPIAGPPAEADGHSATRSLSTATVAPGGQITVTVAASGLGSFGQVVETIPSGFTYVSTTFADGAVVSGQTVSFTIFGSSANFTYTVTASSTAGSYSFSGMVKDSNRATRSVGGSSSVTVSAPASGGTTAARSLSTSTVGTGGQIVVSISAGGLGSFGSVEETLPAGFTYVSTTSADGAVASGQKVTFTILGSSADFTYTVTASSTPGSYTFAGQVKNDQRVASSVGGSSSVTVTGAATGALATRSLSSTAVGAGGQIVVTVAVSGLGAFGQVVETLPAGFTFLSTTLQDDPATSGQLLTFTILSGGTTFTYTVAATTSDGVYTFAGSVTDDQRRRSSVTGDTTVTVGAGAPSDGGGGGGSDSGVNGPPAFSEGARATRGVDEGSRAGTRVGAPVTADDPNDDELEYTISGIDAARFQVDIVSGQITVAAGTTLDHEAKNAYSVDVVATDQGGRSDRITVTINVNNEDEDGAIVLSPAQPRVQSPVTAMVDDPDGGVTDVSWSWASSTDGSVWIAIDGASSASYSPSVDDVGKMLRASATYTDAHGPGKSANGVTDSSVTSVSNIGPEFSSDTAQRSVAEDAAVGSSVGGPVTASDPDQGDTITYSLGGPDSASFGIDAATGQITTAAALDYETRSMYSVTVSAADGKDGDGNPDSTNDDSIDVTIMVTDVEEVVAPEPGDDRDVLPVTGGPAAPTWLISLLAFVAAITVLGGAVMTRRSRGRVA